MASRCTTCGADLGLVRRAQGRAQCETCESRAIEEQRQIQARQEAAIEHIRGLVSSMIEDDYFSEDEERHLVAAAQAQGMPQEVFSSILSEQGDRLMIAMLNAGRLPQLADHGLMLKKDEVAHLRVDAQVLKEVAVREYQGNYSGFSFKVARGVRYRVGGSRGKSVVVGTTIEVADEGELVITSKRGVFRGARQTLEVPWSRLLGMNVFEDGIQFHVSNRKSAPLLRVPSGDVVAATINAVTQEGNA